MKYSLILLFFLATAVFKTAFAQKDSTSIVEQLDYVYAVQKAISNFDRDTYFDLMDNKIDTTYYIGIQHWWLAFNNHRRVMTEGKNWIDVNEEEVAYWENVVYNEPDASWTWCKSMLDYYKAHVKSDDPMSISSQKQNYKAINLYPNPATKMVTIADFADIQSIEVYDLLGKQRKVNWNGIDQLDISSLQNGSYIVYITYNSGEKAYTRLEKQ